MLYVTTRRRNSGVENRTMYDLLVFLQSDIKNAKRDTKTLNDTAFGILRDTYDELYGQDRMISQFHRMYDCCLSFPAFANFIKRRSTTSFNRSLYLIVRSALLREQLGITPYVYSEDFLLWLSRARQHSGTRERLMDFLAIPTTSDTSTAPLSHFGPIANGPSSLG